jgi:hypothetical protein
MDEYKRTIKCGITRWSSPLTMAVLLAFFANVGRNKLNRSILGAPSVWNLPDTTPDSTDDTKSIVY